MYILIDNYDSFTYNLYHYLLELGVEVEVWRNDQLSAADVLAKKPTGIILSPGPCSPDEAGICLELVAAAAGKTPLLGVCLGHQSIGQVFGGTVARAPYVMHGKTSAIKHDATGVFADIPDNYLATRYHSLIVERESLPDCLQVTAQTEDGLIMGLKHRDFEIHGVQFHPESIASEYGHKLLENFITICAEKAKDNV
ncbi:MAG: aminodeoxychorismate/anthranilate synthase component II [Kordiimonadales bacterium]|nr:MAG: aminodeoxychorismate/anthranilate synthase component II [Kordiimonadales bacterium]